MTECSGVQNKRAPLFMNFMLAKEILSFANFYCLTYMNRSQTLMWDYIIYF